MAVNGKIGFLGTWGYIHNRPMIPSIQGLVAEEVLEDSAVGITVT